MIYKRKTQAGKTRWVVKIYIGTSSDGKKLDKHVGTYDTQKLARQAEATAVKQFNGTNGVETIAEFAARWLNDYPRPRGATNRTHEQAIRAFVKAYGGRQPQTITRKEARVWALAQARSHAALRAMWNDMEIEEMVSANPWSRLKLPQSKGRADLTPPTDAEIASLMYYARQLKGSEYGERYASMIEFAAYTGMRRGELVVLTWADIDFHAGRINVSKTLSDDREILPPKNGKPRKIVLAPQAAAALRRLTRSIDANALIFTTPNGRRFTKSTWHYHWNPVRVAAGKPEMDWHELRHWCATHLVTTLGLSFPDAAEQLGHTDGGGLLSRLYFHPDNERALDAVARAFEREATQPTSIDRARDERDDDDLGALVPLR